MAFHPFRSFQRNQKIWMAGATLLAIVSFLFLGVIIQLINSGRGDGASGVETIAESRRFGRITTNELNRLRNNQVALYRFFSVLQRNIALVDPKDEERMQALAPLGAYIRQLEQDQAPERLINIWLVTQYAQEEGLLPDWDDVKKMLMELTGGYLSDAVYDESRQAVGLSHQMVVQLLARQIQWQQAEMRFEMSINAVSPATRWDWFQRLHRQVTIEAVAVPVDAFIDHVAAPTERQLDAFFEQHKGSRFNPMFAESGFIMPMELAFQYVVGAPTQKLLDSVSEEEMLAFYEEHKDTLYRLPTTPLQELPQLPSMMPGNLPGGAFPSFPTPGRLTMPSGPATPGVITPEPAAPVLPNIDDIPPEIPPSETTPAELPSSEAAAEETSAILDVTTRLVSYQTDEEADGEMGEVKEEDEADEPVEMPVGTDEQPEAAQTVPSEMSHALSDETVKVLQQIYSESGTEETVQVLQQIYSAMGLSELEIEQAIAVFVEQLTTGMPEPLGMVEQVGSGVQSNQFGTMQPGTLVLRSPGTEPQESKEVDLSILYRPFDEVKEQIRTRLAYAKAVEALPVILEQMGAYARTYNEHFEQGKQPPPMPDLTGFVAAHGLELVTVPLGNRYTALQTELARGFQERQYIAQKFHSSPLLFAGEIFEGSNGRVLYWVTEEKPELKPDKLDKVRDIVLKRWKEVEARKLALDKAEKLASDAKASGKSLADVFSGHSDTPVVDTEPFTWKTYGGLHPMTAVMRRVSPWLGEVREKGIAAGDAEFDNRWIVAPGEAFMEAVYSLQVGETGVVFNQPQTVAYVVRVTSSSPSADVLWEQFQTTFILVYLAAGYPEMREASREAWLDEIRTKTGFRWVNKPESRETNGFDGDF